jgi:hypothetical protein
LGETDSLEKNRSRKSRGTVPLNKKRNLKRYASLSSPPPALPPQIMRPNLLQFMSACVNIAD